jgi:ATP-dependent Lon protease
MEVRCARVVRWADGKGVVVTGADEGHVARESARLVASTVHRAAVSIAVKLFGMAADSVVPLVEVGMDLHVHYVGVTAPIEHSGYMAATVVALVSLLTGRKPREDTAVLGAINQDADLLPSPFVGERVFTLKEVEQCRRQGVRRLIMAPEVRLDGAAEQATAIKGSDDFEIVRYRSTDEIVRDVFGAA